MNSKTLREVCEELGIPRRAIQGYEEAGIVTPTSRNKMGHLLYGPSAVERIRLARFLQNVGFAVKEIPTFFGSDATEQIRLLEQKRAELQSKTYELQNLISEVEELIRTLG